MGGQFVDVVALLGLFTIVLASVQATPQRAAYSLQAAVDELHRREAAKYPLNAPPPSAHFAAKQLDDWDEETGPGAVSAFRERENLGAGEPTHSELTEQFLREIEEASEHERQERYKAALRQLWEKYQQQENELNTNANNNNHNGDEELEEQQLFEQKKRMRMPPYYLLMQKKRSYPVLPWLPYNSDKKKRFPVAKRAAGESPLAKTDERVAQELSELFGKPVEQQQSEEKKKRSTEEQLKPAPTTHLPETAATATALGDMRLEINFQRVNVTNGVAKEAQTQTPPKAAGTGEMVMHGHGGHHRKRSEHHSDEEYGEHDEHDGEGEGEESSDEDDHDEFDEDEEGENDGEGEGDAGEKRRKKKRAASSKHMHGPSVGHLMLRAKKSIDWSQYFGLDRKKKSEQLSDGESKKRSTDDDSNNDDDQNEEMQKKKRDIDPEKLESMDKKLQSIEDFIIDETIKYTGAHEGIKNQDEIRKLKEHVLSRLATAYSLEKMRRALDKLRQSVDAENHLLRNVIEPESEENSLDERWPAKKRFSVKKEQAEDQAEDDSNPQQSKKKRSGYMRYPEQPNTMEEALSMNSAPYETLNDAYLGNKNYIIGSNQCPIIESMAERCRSVDLISGDLNQELMPLCGVHQICYLCGASQVACDYQYLAEADTICGSSNDCQASARSVLMILRGTPGRQLGPRECLKNPCLYRAMREIGL
ncbi:histone-lysine N-methyltransferase, H3 lysine-79 specific isoform X2 [Drosophila grimshawi]|uniref:histone-lysine N-methyltransferase, H3 lysine-79 specific isoform X2 n=1 Tax=Drosophila grimshawi TaxID=7222 RepID=UPI000C8713F9|nr:histone-lysine N-methyltransferase, H3 lysine-79 specific isoform X2 [Drosophila grimshawi]